jgi:error-prone DNA polymerase
LLELVAQTNLGVRFFQEQLLKMAMVVAGFSGGEAEEPAAPWIQAPEKRMREIEAKLRAGMERNGIAREAQEQIVLPSLLRAVWLSRIPRRQLRPARLCQRVSEVPLSRGLHRCPLNNQPMGFRQPCHSGRKTRSATD